MKICILGTAPALSRAPFGDPSWEFWAVPGCYSPEKPERNSKLNRVYEIHSPENMTISCETRPGFIEFAKGLKQSFILREFHPSYPEARIYEKERFLTLHGRSPFSCSVSWIAAEAIEALEQSSDNEKVIGFWGVNMAHDTEYAYQKPGVRELIGYARGRGIKIEVEEGSELMSTPCLYGFEDIPPAFKIIRVRTKELHDKHENHVKNHEIAAQTINYMNGALKEYEFLESKPTPEQLQERVKMLEEQKVLAQKDFERESVSMHVLKGAMEEHAWVENNFYARRTDS